MVIGRFHAFARHEILVDQAETIDRTQLLELFLLDQLAYIRLAGVEHHPAFERIGPIHLHLDNELPVVIVHTTDIDHRPLETRQLGKEIGIKVFDTDDFAPGVKWQHRVQETDKQARVVAEYLPECEVVLGVEVRYWHGKNLWLR